LIEEDYTGNPHRCASKQNYPLDVNYVIISKCFAIFWTPDCCSE